MTPEQFEEIFEKVKNQHDSIQFLRNLILKLGIEGKIVDHIETSSSLEKHVLELAKQRQTANSNKRAQTSRNALHDFRLDFDIPKNWTIKNLGDICSKITDGAHKTPNYKETGIPFLSIKDFSSGTLRFDECKYISSEEHDLLFDRCNPEKGDVILGRIGTLGKAIEITVDFEFSLFVSVGLLKPIKSCVDSSYLAYLINSPVISEQFDLIKVGGGTHTNKLNLTDLYNLIIPLPPLEEQERIVAKVDEIMALCDNLENANQKTNQTKLTYLKSVTKHISKGALNNDKQAILSNALTVAPKNAEGIQELKKVCINFGIQMNHQSDEENGKIYGKIQELTDRMKVDKLLPKSFKIQQSDSEMFSKLTCLSLGSVAFVEKGKTGIKSAEPGEYPLVVTAEERQTCKSYDFDTEAAIVPLVSSTGHGHASINRLHYETGKFALGTILAAIIPFDKKLISSRFLFEYLTTFKEELLVSKMIGTANVTLSIDKIKSVTIPIISPKTQKWICDFCETCDELTENLKEPENIKSKLLKTLVA